MLVKYIYKVIYISRGYGQRYPKHDVGSMGTHISARGPVIDFLYVVHDITVLVLILLIVL